MSVRVLQFILAGVVSFPATSAVVRAAEAATAAPWYQTLRPGVTRAEIERFAGGPLVRRGDVEVWAAPPGGQIEFIFRGDVLHRADYKNAPPEALNGLYATFGTSSEATVAARREYLRGGSYAILPRFASISPTANRGQLIRTAKYLGAACYEVDGQYLVIESILSVGTGAFADKAARVLLVGADGKEKTLYRADEHWSDLRPPGLSRSAAAQRETTLRKLGLAALERPVTEVLGPEDSRMGSGIDFRIYYLPSGLAIVTAGGPGVVDGVRRFDRIQGINISSPGGPRQWVPFQEWLAAGASGRR